MNKMQIRGIKDLLVEASRLEEVAFILKASARKLCDHKDDGVLQIATGLGIGVGEEECKICGRPSMLY